MHARTHRPSASRHPVARPAVLRAETADLPPETDAWWLSRSAAPTFARRRVGLSDACVRGLRAAGASASSIAVEFNGARFTGATVVMSAGRYELDLGDALAAAMAEVLDEDDGLVVALLPHRAPPTLAIEPFVDG